jgi:ribonuclease Z
MSFALTILGSSSAVPTSKRFPTAQVLNVHERFFLIDCGEGTQIQLKRFAINLSRINHIFISHLHGDHVFGLFGLMSTYTLLGRKSDLHIFAHRDLEDSLEHFKKYFGIGLTYQIIFHPFIAVEQTEIYSDKHLTVELIPLRHSIPVAGFLFREKEKPLNVKKDVIEKYSPGFRDILNIKAGADFVTASGVIIKNSELTLPRLKPRSYAFCTDTAYFSKLAASVKNVDLLYYEATFAEADKKLAKITGHSTTTQAAQLAKNAHAGKLLIGHFSTRYKNIALLENEARDIFPDTVAVEDGEKFEVRQRRIE